jgi:uncharacterized membrane protein (DUF106 family)
LKKKALALIILVLLSSVFLYMAFSSVFAQQVGTNVVTVNPGSGAIGSEVNVQGTIDTPNGSYLVYFGDQLVINSTSDGYSVSTNFTVPNLTTGNYNITLQDATSNHSATKSFAITTVAPSGFSAIPWSTLSIMGISLTIALVNSGLNRLLISRFVGWEEYKSMQKEMAEHRAQQMAAMRANDKKQLEKLKKKESQMMNMQKKMAKPQLILFALTFIYIFFWPVLTGFFPKAVVHVPGFGPQPFFIWYLLCSFFFGTLASRILGILPME